MDSDANEIESICYSYDTYFSTFLLGDSGGVPANEFPTFSEGLVSYVAMLSLIFNN